MLNTAYIDLRILRQNAIKIKNALNGALFCAVVKADAYGHGAPTVANAIYDLADCYAVALLEEGVALRQSGIDKDILVLIPIFSEDVKEAVEYNFTLTVCDIINATMIEKECAKRNKRVKVHLKYDTGMHRFGAPTLRELQKLLRHIDSLCPHLIVSGLYSHFYDAENEEAVKLQLKRFKLAKERIKSYNKKVITHISASGGLLRGAESEMARIGILLYGYKPFPSDKISVMPIMEIVAPSVKQMKIGKGEHVLYGDYRLKDAEKISLVRYGYADGLTRRSGEVNNRCMDISAVSGVYGEYPVLKNADELAEKEGTISYEILCSAAKRAEKIYLR